MANSDSWVSQAAAAAAAAAAVADDDDRMCQSYRVHERIWKLQLLPIAAHSAVVVEKNHSMFFFLLLQISEEQGWIPT